MKMAEALRWINGEMDEGFMVHFEWIAGGILQSDHFPDKRAGEELIKDEATAWLMAARFAKATEGKTCNLYVTDKNFNPVKNYQALIIRNR